MNRGIRLDDEIIAIREINLIIKIRDEVSQEIREKVWNRCCFNFIQIESMFTEMLRLFSEKGEYGKRQKNSSKIK
jgi:hypothetical protein